MMFWFVTVILLINAAVQAAPTEKLGVRFEKRGSLPTLTLPDATYRADSYNSQSDVCYSIPGLRYVEP